MNQNQRTSQLLQCLKVVILQDKHAIETLRECEKTAGVEIYTTPLAFRVPMRYFIGNRFLSSSYNSIPSCDCSFEHEYFDYLRNGHCNEDMFNRIYSNVINGRCEHISEENSIHVHGKSAMVYLIHAAVATNNKKVTKYISRQILKRSHKKLYHLTTGVGGLTAAHIAVVKGSKDAIVYVLVTGIHDCNYFDDFFPFPFPCREKSVLYKRNGTGKVETVVLRTCGVLVPLLKLYSSPVQLNILLSLLTVLNQSDLEELMHYYLSVRDEELARILLNDRNTASMSLSSSILLNAIFSHAHDFVNIWISQKQSLSVEVKGTKIHVLFMAKALGCQKCTSLVCRGMKKDPNEQSENYTFDSSDLSPYIVACDFAKRFGYKTDTLLSILKDLYYKGSCSLHQQNCSSETVLHVLAKSDFYNNEAMKYLLDIGSDVNARDDNGNTPLHDIVISSNCGAVAVKCLLEHGADINLSNFNGQIPFMQLLRKAEQKCSYRHFPALLDLTSGSENDTLSECIKYMLYYNPRVDLHQDVFASVENIDCDNTFDGYINLPIVPSDKSLSLFAVLLELGFVNFRTEESDPPQYGLRLSYLLRSHSTCKHLKRTECYDYFKKFTDQPRSLQSICRVQIRQAFPGCRLHKLFQLVQIPKSLREFILCKNVLFYNA